MSFGQVKALLGGGDGARRAPASPLALGLLLGLLGGCQIAPPEPRVPSPGHVDTQVRQPAADIPPPVSVAPVLPPPQPAAPTETYTVVVNEVPVKELLFALARDAAINVDVHPEISGQVTLNAVDQTLNQILDRIARQIDITYRVEDRTLLIAPDRPFLRTYRVDYVNMSRNVGGSVTVATQLDTTGGSGEGGGSGGGNNSTTEVSTVSNNRFWETLVTNVQTLVANEDAVASGAASPGSLSVVANPESGIIIVRATDRQHAQVRAYLDEVLASVRRQVLVEVTIVEVELSDNYQAGIDWSKLAQRAGFSFSQSLLGGNLAAAPFFFLQYASERTGVAGVAGDEANNVRTADAEGISATVRLLKEFGNTRVLSSPKLMVLNNQTAVLKVVNNLVYFDVEATPAVATVGAGGGVIAGDPAITTSARTVPVGLVMAVTPQVSSSDEVILNVRPTISRLDQFILDPQPDLANAGQVNRVPQISVREMESMLRVNSGQTAVLGGLMVDDARRDSDEVPFVSELPGVGEAFRYRNNQLTKNELVIFLRPWVIRTPSVTADLDGFKPFLPENLRPAEPLKQIKPEPQ